MQKLHIYLLLAGLGCWNLNGYTESLQQVFSFDPNSLHAQSFGDYIRLDMEGATLAPDAPGHPWLPTKTANILLPSGARALNIEVTADEAMIASDILILPVQPDYPPSQPRPAFVEPDQAVYASHTTIPEASAAMGMTHKMRDYTFVSIRLNPVRYLPALRQIFFASSITVTVHYDMPPPEQQPTGTTKRTDRFTGMVADLVANPQMLQNYERPTFTQQGDATLAAVDYLIIAGETETISMLEDLQLLANHRQNFNNINTLVVPLNWVLYFDGTKPGGGSDIQTSIRNCIKYFVKYSGTTYVLLAGDGNFMPIRRCYVSSGDKIESNMPTDLYYSALDGNWDANCNSIYGEAGVPPEGDDVDLAPDVIVGRIPLNDTQMRRYIEKLITYETETMPEGFANKMLFCGAKAGDFMSGTDEVYDGLAQFDRSGDISDSEIWCRRMYRDTIQPYWQANPFRVFADTITSWDTSDYGDYPQNADNLITRFNEGWQHLFFMTHGSPTSWSLENGAFDKSKAAFLNKKTVFVYTTACNTGKFDDNNGSLSQAFLLNPIGGALAYMGCSRFGWYGPLTYYGGTSMEYSHAFYKQIFQYNRSTLGEAFAYHKMAMISFLTQFNTSLRWVQFGLNLQGEPLLQTHMGRLSTSPQSISNQCVIGHNALSQTLEIFHSGARVFNYTIATNNAWLQITPTSGIMSNTVNTHTISFAGSSNLSLGNNLSQLRVISTNLGAGMTQTVAVTVYVWPQPVPANEIAVSQGTSPDYARVNWTQVQALNIEIWRGTSASVNNAQKVGETPGTATYFDDTTAVPGRKYYYWMRTITLGIYSEFSPSATGFKKLRPPSTISAGKAAHDNLVLVSWNAAIGDVTQYEVLRNISAGNPAYLGTSSGLSYNDTSAAPGVRYYYWVRAQNALGKSIAGVFTEGYRRQTPPDAIQASQGTYPGKVVVSWNTVSGASAYEIWRNNIRIGTSQTLNFSDTSVGFGREYDYKVRGFNAVCTGSFSVAVSGWSATDYQLVLNASAGLYIQKVRLTWNPVADAQGYEIRRSTNSDFSNSEIIASTINPNYDDAQATVGRQYYYRVRAFKGSTLEWWSSIGSGWRKLSAPAQLTASQGTSPGGIKLTWVKVAGATSYEIWGSFSDDMSAAIKLGETEQTSFIDRAVAMGGIKYYRVRALSNTANSDYSFIVCGQAPLKCLLGGTNNTPLPADYDGDGIDDPAVYDSTSGLWRILMSSEAYREKRYPNRGGPAWQPVPGDYDGDGISDMAIYATNGAWQFWLSGSGQAKFQATGWGGAEWTPIPGDYDGDGRLDPAVYHPEYGAWRIWLSSIGYKRTQVNGWGGTGWIPAQGDYDGDGLCDAAVYSPASGAWRFWLSGNGYRHLTQRGWGLSGALPIIGDYDGDRLTDPALYSETTGKWNIWLSGSGYRKEAVSIGGNGYQAAPLDYNGDGILDLTIYTRATGIWWISP